MINTRYLAQFLNRVLIRNCLLTMSSEENNIPFDSKRPQFGNRLLKDPNKVFEHNAWDHVEWDEDQEKQAQEKVKKNSSVCVPHELKEKYEHEASAYWDKFYNIHENRFFKDRHWLFTEFPELFPKESKETNDLSLQVSSLKIESEQSVCGMPANEKVDAESKYPGSSATTRIFEVGCGVGNTVFPLLSTNNSPDMFLYCCDFSDVAISLLKENPDYDASRCYAFVCDISSESWDVPFPEQSLDIVIMIFVLSAVCPKRMQHVINTLVKYLKPGGLFLFRDYGRYDMAQLRFKQGSCLEENFYVRGDGTRVYFFTEDEVDKMFIEAGLSKELLLTDRRLQVNRGKQLKMYRVWILAKYRKMVIS